MAYITNLPPTLARTGQSTYELRDSTGAVIQTYDQVQFDHPSDWWGDILVYIDENTANNDVLGKVHDLSLLIINRDYAYVNEV